MNLKNLRSAIPDVYKSRATLSRGFFLVMALLLTFSAHAQWVRKADALKKRSEVTSVVYNNKLYTFAGFGNDALETEPSSEVYDPATDTWTLLASMPAGKTVTHQGVVLIDNTVWHIAGRVGTHPGPLTSETWIYNITTDSWLPGPQLKDPATGNPLLWGGGAAVLLGRTLHLFGGFIKNACSNDQDTYHLTLNVDEWVHSGVARWENKRKPLPLKRCHVLTAALGGKIYALGGQFGHDCGEVDQPIAHVYDPLTDSWKQLPSLPAPRSHAEGGVFALDGKIYIVGGQQALSRNTNKVTVFDPAANNGQGAWSEDPALVLPYGYEGLSAKVIGNTFIYSHGGIGSSQNVQNRTYTRTITRNPVRTLGFSASCLTVSLPVGEEAKRENLLFTIDGATAYQLASDAPWLTVTKNVAGTALPSGVPLEVQVNAAGLAPGNYTGKVTVTGTGEAAYTPASFCVNLTVTGLPNTAPVLAIVGDHEATVGHPFAFTATATDAENDVLSYSLLGAPTGAAIHPTTGVFSWTPLLAGTYSFTVKVTDNGIPALSGEAKVDVKVAAAPSSLVTRINAGGPAYVTATGNTYAADAFFSGGKLTTYTAGEVAGTDNDELYRSGRFGEAFSYNIPTGNGAFALTLHFNETYWGNLSGGGIGSRKFNVDAEGVRKLTEYDIFAQAGGAMKAVSETIPVSVADGILTIRFTKGSADFPRVSAIEVVPVETPAPAGSVLLVVNGTPLNAGDAAVRTRLEGAGYTVIVKGHDAVAAADAEGKSVVVISSTITSGKVSTKFRNVAVPVLNWEPFLNDDLGLTGPDESNWGILPEQTQLAVVQSGHPLSAGLSGAVAVAQGNAQFSWATPGSEATLIATASGDAAKKMIFAYETGAAMVGLNAPARRVGFFLYNDTAEGLSAEGWTLFDAAIDWLTGNTPAAAARRRTGTAAMNPEKARLEAFPNPASGKVHLRLPGLPGNPARVQVINALGVTCRFFALTTSRENDTQTVMVSGLPAGVYLIRVQQAGETYFTKLVVSGQ